MKGFDEFKENILDGMMQSIKEPSYDNSTLPRKKFMPPSNVEQDVKDDVD